MGVRLQRAFCAPADLEPGQYTAEPAPRVAGAKIALCCPGCGGQAELGEHHAIDRGGRVTPAFKCPVETCSVFEWLYLESWGAQ